MKGARGAALRISLLACGACSITGDDLSPRRAAGRLESQPASVGAVWDASVPPTSEADASPSLPDAMGNSCSVGEASCDLPLESASPCDGGACTPGGCAGAGCDAATCADGGACEPTGCFGPSCRAGSCADGAQNQNESDTDCGGICGASCREGQGCVTADDCESNVCSPAGCNDAAAADANAESCCHAPTCSDGVRNGDEPLVDCGNESCGPCPSGAACRMDADCRSGSCAPDGSCAARCRGDQDCEGGSCMGGFCIFCDNGVVDGSESDVDCGGQCPPCSAGERCAVDGDCQQDACESGRCCGGRERDCTRCAERLAQNGLNCGNTSDEVAAQGCRAFLDCLANSEACTLRHAPGCSEAPGGACNHLNFGGNDSAALTLADAILGDATCQF